MTIGILTEKPSAARHFAAALGGMSGTFNGEAYVIAHARGHLYELAKPEEMLDDPSLVEYYKRWALGNLPWNADDFNWKLSTIKNAASVASDVQRTLTGCDEIVVATDVDPSGEGGMIAVNAFLELGLKPKSWSRMYFTDEAPVSLQKAFGARKPIPSILDFDEYKKAMHRNRFDFLSIQWSRVATIMVRGAGQDTVIRQGRLKSAMVKLVGDQLKAHNDYVKKPFFQNRFRDEHGVMYTNPEEPRFEQQAQVQQDYLASAVIVDSTTPKQTAPPKMYDLAALSALLAGTVKAKQVLDVYQKMYEDQVVSYPRTEDKTITPEQFAELLPLVDQIAAVVGVDAALLTNRSPRSTHVKAQGAHGANRPGLKVPASIDQITQKYGETGRLIYEALAKNFLATLAPDYLYDQQKGHVERYPEFVGLANIPKSAGWKAVFDPDAGEAPADADDETAANTKGLGKQAEPFVYEGANKRPEHPSMKWLMQQLEKRDVGTGATRTTTYSDVTSSTAKYPLLVEKGRKLTLAKEGEMSWLLLPGTHIGDLALTEKVFADMRDVAAGTANSDELLARVADWVREDIATMQKNAATMRQTLGFTESAVVQKEKYAGVWGKTGQKVAITRSWGGHRFTDDECERLLAGEVVDIVGKSSKDGQPYDAYGELQVQEFKGKKYLGFQHLGYGKASSIKRDASGEIMPPTEWNGHTFTDAEIQKLMAGEGVEADDLVSRTKGSIYSGTLSWKAAKSGEAKKIVMQLGSSTPPKSWGGHTFTEDEIAMLMIGEGVKADDFVSKAKGTTYSTTVWFEEEKPGGGKKIVAEFMKKNAGGKAGAGKAPAGKRPASRSRKPAFSPSR